MGQNVAKIKKLIEDKKNKIRERIKKFFEVTYTYQVLHLCISYSIRLFEPKKILSTSIKICITNNP